MVMNNPNDDTQAFIERNSPGFTAGLMPEEAWHKYLIANGASDGSSVQDVAESLLAAKGYADGFYEDILRAYLATKGFIGDDAEYQWLQSGTI